MTKSGKLRGRPAEFDYNVVLEKALKVFWARGYEGASMTELTSAMEINKPSLYAAFGNKEALFQKALDKYLSDFVAYIGNAMREPTARQVAEKILRDSAEFLTDPENPRGCLINVGTLMCGKEAEPIQQVLVSYRKRYENALADRFELAKKQLDLPQDVSPKQLAKYVVTTHQGMSVQAINGTTREELLAVVDQALKSWPT